MAFFFAAVLVAVITILLSFFYWLQQQQQQRKNSSSSNMGHKNSTLHSQFRNQSDGPNCDLVGMTNSGYGGNNHPDTFVSIKHGPFKRKLSMRNISIRRSFHMGGKHNNRQKNNKYHHQQQPLNDYSTTPTNITTNSRIGISATTDHLPSTSSNLINNSSNTQSSNGIISISGPSTSNHHHHHHHNNNHNNHNTHPNHQTPVLPRSNNTGKRSSNHREKFGKKNEDFCFP